MKNRRLPIGGKYTKQFVDLIKAIDHLIKNHISQDFLSMLHRIDHYLFSISDNKILRSKEEFDYLQDILKRLSDSYVTLDRISYNVDFYKTILKEHLILNPSEYSLDLYEKDDHDMFKWLSDLVEELKILDGYDYWVEDMRDEFENHYGEENGQHPKRYIKEYVPEVNQKNVDLIVKYFKNRLKMFKKDIEEYRDTGDLFNLLYDSNFIDPKIISSIIDRELVIKGELFDLIIKLLSEFEEYLTSEDNIETIMAVLLLGLNESERREIVRSILNREDVNINGKEIEFFKRSTIDNEFRDQLLECSIFKNTPEIIEYKNSELSNLISRIYERLNEISLEEISWLDFVMYKGDPLYTSVSETLEAEKKIFRITKETYIKLKFIVDRTYKLDRIDEEGIFAKISNSTLNLILTSENRSQNSSLLSLLKCYFYANLM